MMPEAKQTILVDLAAENAVLPSALTAVSSCLSLILRPGRLEKLYGVVDQKSVDTRIAAIGWEPASLAGVS
jgi:hypothetical protein